MEQVGDILGELLGIGALSREVKELKRLSSNRFKSVEAHTKELKEIIMTLADTIKQLVAVEIEDGKKLVEANVNLSAALVNANDKVKELETLLEGQPALLAELAGVKEELGLASDAAQLIAGINPTPVSDGVVDQVIDDPDVETPEIVEDAPETDVDVIQSGEVVNAAVDALE